MAGEQILTDRPLPGARLNLAHPLAKGLIGCWLLNEQGNRAMDLSPYKNHGTLAGFDSPPKRPFNGLLFNGTSMYMTAGSGAALSKALSGAKGITIVFWFKNSTLPAAGKTHYFIESLINAIPNTGFQMGIVQSLAGIQVGGRSTTADTFQSTSASFASTGLWTCAIGILDFVGKTIAIDLNGVNKVSTGVTFGATSYTINAPTIAETLGVRTALGAGMYYNGYMALAEIYKSALSLESRQALYLSPYAPFGTKMFI